MFLLSISIIAAIPAIIGGLLVAIPVWKIQKYFISRRDYYRQTPYEIFDTKFVSTSAVFLFVAGIIYIYRSRHLNTPKRKLIILAKSIA
ncbi:MAG: hypothetical protein HYR66_16565 [Sphingobacteriales bacterium]|nr:hypothetical protein [Sphingobacteriales bacterium]MBI3717897.1 hypothetical protein [Sphingobacteriales bacterium]